MSEHRNAYYYETMMYISYLKHAMNYKQNIISFFITLLKLSRLTSITKKKYIKIISINKHSYRFIGWLCVIDVF